MIIVDVEGSFRYDMKNCFCCKKQVILYMELNKTSLTLFSDEIKHIVFLRIPRQSIVAINKRQIDRYDVFKFSLHYKTNNSNIMKEIKLRARSRSDTDYWITTLRKIIQPKPYEFEYNSITEEKATLLFKYGDMKKFYISICHLEYILHKDSMKDFFRVYNNKRKINDCNNNKTKADSNNNKDKEDNDDDDFSDVFNDDSNHSQNQLKNIQIEGIKEDKKDNNSIEVNNLISINLNNENNNDAPNHNVNGFLNNNNQRDSNEEVDENEITLELKI